MAPSDDTAGLRALFVNQGALGASVQGHTMTSEAIRAGLAGQDGLDVRHAFLPPWSRGAEWIARSLPVLGRHDLDFKAFRFHCIESLRGRRLIRAELSRFPPDALHVTSHTPGFLMPDIMSRIPTVLCVDATVDAWERMSIWRPQTQFSDIALSPSLWLERLAFRRAAAVVCMTDWAAGGVQTAAPSAHTATIHPGISRRRFHPAPQVARERSRVLFVGGRFEAKGGADLVKALGPELGRTIDLDIVTGDATPELPGIRTHRLNNADPRLVDLYQQADVVCLPTYGDASPWTILEAMACGAPVVATRVGAIPELLQDGDGGVLVTPGQPRELREAVGRLLADDAWRRAIAARGLELIARRYDVERQGRVLTELLRGVVARGARAAPAVHPEPWPLPSMGDR